MGIDSDRPVGPAFDRAEGADVGADYTATNLGGHAPTIAGPDLAGGSLFANQTLADIADLGSVR